jgi:AcrR family transcriptional regulator
VSFHARTTPEQQLMFKNIFWWYDGPMPYRPEHRARTRARIVDSARVLFNRRGFDAVSIDEVMAHAGLTRGGFYRHFAGKGELYAEAIALSISITPWSRWQGVGVNLAAPDAARQLVRTYLSNPHFADIDNGCPLVSLPSEVSRADPEVRRAYERVFVAMVGVFDDTLHDRQRALALAGICVGGMVVARAIADAGLADELRAASAAIAFELGGWAKPRRTRPRHDAHRRSEHATTRAAGRRVGASRSLRRRRRLGSP